jgi:hypothetical protein
MDFLDINAAATLARIACARTTLSILATPSQRELLSAAGAPPGSTQP